MTGNKVVKLWTAIVTAFLALCTALGLVTATTAAAAPAEPRSESPQGSTAERTVPAIPSLNPWSLANGRALPPTMKQRIRAEAHGKAPRCRHRPLAETSETHETHEAPETKPADGSNTADRLTAPLDC